MKILENSLHPKPNKSKVMKNVWLLLHVISIKNGAELITARTRQATSSRADSPVLEKFSTALHKLRVRAPALLIHS